MLVGAAAGVSAALRRFWAIQEYIINDVIRPDLNLDPYPQSGPHALLREQKTPILCAFGDCVGPAQAVLPPHVRLTGFWLGASDDTWEATSNLKELFASQQPYAYVRVINADEPTNERGFAALVEAIDRQRLCAVISSDCWSNDFVARNMSSTHFRVSDQVPHDRVLAGAQVAIHTGGAAMVGETLRAGTPSVVVPTLGDEFFWASILHKLGVAADPIPMAGVTVNSFVEAIGSARGELLRSRATDWRPRFSGEKGPSVALEVLRHWGLCEEQPAGL